MRWSRWAREGQSDTPAASAGPAAAAAAVAGRGRGPGAPLLLLLLLLPPPRDARPAPGSTFTYTNPSPPPCEVHRSVTLPDGSVQLFDGSVRDPTGHEYPRGTYYTTEGRTRGCACQVGTCFFKCCPWGRMLSRDKSCVPLREVADDALSPIPPDPTSKEAVHLVLDLYSPENLSKSLLSSVPPPKNWIVVEGWPTNHGMFRLNPREEDNDQFYLLANASLYVPRLYTEALPAVQFCMDVFEDTREVSALVAFPPREGADTSGPVDEESFYPYTLYLTGLLVSLPFLVATLAVYACFSELQNLHGKSLICHVTAMILAYVVLVLVYFKVGIENNVMCVVFGFGVQYFFLVTFSWLNVMCFDIWWTFSGFGAVHGAPSVPDRERFRFVAYSAYAWGVPSAILVVTLVLQLAGDSLPTSVPRPDVGSERCLLGPKANLAYFLGPVAVLLVCNVVLFVHTAVRIVRLRRETRALKSAESRRHSDERQRYNVYLKLFVIMGVNWIAEVASAFFPDFSYLWIVPDITNSLQGIFIFMMFVATGRVRRLVVDRLLHRVRPHVTSNSSTKSTRANASSSRKSAPPPPPGAANGCLPPDPHRPRSRDAPTPTPTATPASTVLKGAAQNDVTAEKGVEIDCSMPGRPAERCDGDGAPLAAPLKLEEESLGGASPCVASSPLAPVVHAGA